MKNFDSKTDGRARRTLHSAFVDERYEGKRGRESIEVRALVFHEDDINWVNLFYMDPCILRSC